MKIILKTFLEISKILFRFNLFFKEVSEMYNLGHSDIKLKEVMISTQRLITIFGLTKSPVFCFINSPNSKGS